MGNIGYACINFTLNNNPKVKITTNRTVKLNTFNTKGLAYVSELVVQNLKDLITIIKWNNNNNIKFYRMSSEIFPFGDKYHIKDLPQKHLIISLLKQAGSLATQYGQRLTYHPGPFTILASDNEAVVTNAINTLEHHAEVMDYMGLSKTPYNKINIHIGTTKGSKELCLIRFAQNFQKLSDSVKKRLTVENDDKQSMYSINDLLNLHNMIGIPIVLDVYHHILHPDNTSINEAYTIAKFTWPKGIVPVIHYSESKMLHENDNTIKIQAHSDYINSLPEIYDADIMVESKMKDLAILKFIKNISE